MLFTSRHTVDAFRPMRSAIVRNDSPAASPREISSRSSSDKRSGDRFRSGGVGRFARRIARATAHRDLLISSLIFQNGAPSATNAAICARSSP